MNSDAWFGIVLILLLAAVRGYFVWAEKQKPAAVEGATVLRYPRSGPIFGIVLGVVFAAPSLAAAIGFLMDRQPQLPGSPSVLSTVASLLALFVAFALLGFGAALSSARVTIS